MTDLGRLVSQSHLIRDYGYFVDWPLRACYHLAKWVQTKAEDIVDFKGKGNPALEFQLGICTHLKNDIDLGQEGIIFKSLIVNCPS